MRIVFMGTPEFAVPTLIELAARGHEIAAVYTRPPAAAGRGLGERRSPVHQAALRLGAKVEHPKSLKGAAEQEAFRAYNADVAITVAYGLILPKAILAAPRFGAFNLHASLLPHWRGAAPINRAIMAGDAESGVSVMQMDEGLDTGPVALVERVAIGPNMTAGELHDRLATVGADLTARALVTLERGSLTFQQQGEEGATYAKKVENAETRINWSKPAADVHNHIRGLSPFPGAWFELGGTRVRALRSERADRSGKPGTTLDDRLTVACGGGSVRLLEVQRAGAKAMKAESFLRGTPVAAGTALS
jgi:methionyl-tRNA formyltransferase